MTQKWYKNYWFYLILGITILAAILRLYGLAGRDIWMDEALDVAQAKEGLWAITRDVGTPIHYYFIWAMLPFGVNTVSLALPGVALCVAAVPLFYFFVKDLLDKNAAVIAACLVAISPMLIEFSQQILHYAYLIFFTTLSLFFLGRLLTRKRKILYFLLWIGATILNLLTMAPAFWVAAIQVIFLSVYLLVNIRQLWPVVSRWLKKMPWYFYVIVAAVAGSGIWFFSHSYYPKTITEQTAHGAIEELPVGISLNLKGFTHVEISWPFIKAIFEWFGTYDGTLALWVLLSLAIIGLVFMLLRKKTAFFILSLFWIILPFVALFTIGISHWFEEKYFIFVIPIYLAAIAYGITSLGEVIRALVTKKKGFFSQTSAKLYSIRSNVILVIILMIATFGVFIPLSAKTLKETYGFSIRDNSGYSWQAAFEYIKGNAKENDLIINDDPLTVFHSFYLGDEGEYKTWFPLTYFTQNDTGAYEDFIEQTVANNSHVWLPTSQPFANTIYPDLVEVSSTASVKGMGVYELKFKERQPPKIEIDQSGKWKYLEDFDKPRYLHDALATENITWPMNASGLSPYDRSKPATIEYLLTFDKPTKDFVLETKFQITGDQGRVNICVGDSRDSYVLQQEIDGKSSGQSVIVDLGTARQAFDKKYIKIEMQVDQNQITPIPDIKFDMLAAYSKRGKAEFEEVKSPTGKTLFVYDFGLAEKVEKKWFLDSLKNKGWMQASSGVLYTTSAPTDADPLTYRFELESALSGGSLQLETYADKENQIQVYVGKREDQMQLVHANDNHGMQQAEIDLSDFKGAKDLYVQAKTRDASSSAQFRKARLELTLQ